MNIEYLFASVIATEAFCRK